MADPSESRLTHSARGAGFIPPRTPRASRSPARDYRPNGKCVQTTLLRESSTVVARCNCVPPRHLQSFAAARKCAKLVARCAQTRRWRHTMGANARRSHATTACVHAESRPGRPVRGRAAVPPGLACESPDPILTQRNGGSIDTVHAVWRTVAPARPVGSSGSRVSAVGSDSDAHRPSSVEFPLRPRGLSGRRRPSTLAG